MLILSISIIVLYSRNILSRPADQFLLRGTIPKVIVVFLRVPTIALGISDLNVIMKLLTYRSNERLDPKDSFLFHCFEIENLTFEIIQILFSLTLRLILDPIV